MIDKGGKDVLSISSHDKHAEIPCLGIMHVSIISDPNDHGADSALNCPISVLLILSYMCYQFSSKHTEHGTNVI